MLMRTIGVLIVLTVLIPACSSNSKPKSLPPQTMAPELPTMDEPVSNAPQEMGPEAISNDEIYGDEDAAQDPESDENFERKNEGPQGAITIVVESATEDDEQANSLFAASQRERDRRKDVGESSVTLTNESLKEHSKGGLTIIEAEDEGESGEAVEGEEESILESAWEQEKYWRARVLDQRVAWREALDSIDELEREIATLRRNFYAEDDPFYRDSQIKPAWDNALNELDDARQTVLRSQQEVEDTIDEGHRAGALPGWLREGIELEPTEEELAHHKVDDSEFYEPIEPVIADEGNDGR